MAYQLNVRGGVGALRSRLATEGFDLPSVRAESVARFLHEPDLKQAYLAECDEIIEQRLNAFDPNAWPVHGPIRARLDVARKEDNFAILEELIDAAKEKEAAKILGRWPDQITKRSELKAFAHEFAKERGFVSTKCGFQRTKVCLEKNERRSKLLWRNLGRRRRTAQ